MSNPRKKHVLSEQPHRPLAQAVADAIMKALKQNSEAIKNWKLKEGSAPGQFYLRDKDHAYRIDVWRVNPLVFSKAYKEPKGS